MLKIRASEYKTRELLEKIFLKKAFDPFAVYKPRPKFEKHYVSKHDKLVREKILSIRKKNLDQDAKSFFSKH